MVALRSAAFDGGYAPMPPTGTRATPLPTMKTCPREARNAGIASRTSASGPTTCVPNCAETLSSLCIAIGPVATMPALFTEHVDAAERADGAADQSGRVRRIADIGRRRSTIMPPSSPTWAASAASALTLRPTAYTA